MDKKQKILLHIDSSRIYGRSLLRGFIKYAKLHTDWILFGDITYFQRNISNKQRIEEIQEQKPDATVIREPQAIKQLLALNIPTILCANLLNTTSIKKQTSKYSTIIPDGQKIGRMGATYFLEKGYKNFAFVGYNNTGWSQSRENGFSATIQEKELETFTLNIPHNNNRNKDTENLAQWLQKLPKPIAVMACNDTRALNVINACRIAELHVPEDIAVLGVDNDDVVCEMSAPSISSIELGAKKTGYETAELLHQMLTSEHPVPIQDIPVNPLYVVTRQSTDSTAIEDPIVAGALNFIRNNIHTPIQVNTIVENACISRRNLELRFHKIIGRGIQNEIRRLRVKAISRMSLETNLPVHEIAQNFGYNDATNLSRFFKKEAGMSLLEYRKKYKI